MRAVRRLGRVVAAIGIACAVATLGVSPAAACLAGGGVEPWPPRLPISIAAEATVIQRVHPYGVLEMRLDRLYRGDLQSTFRLDTGGDCFVDQTRLNAGQRISFVVIDTPTTPITAGDVWFLDASGKITGWGSTMFDPHSRGYQTVKDLLAAMGLPDAAMDARPDLRVLGLLLLGAAVAVWFGRSNGSGQH
jgi:hypothetical protein